MQLYLLNKAYKVNIRYISNMNQYEICLLNGEVFQVTDHAIPHLIDTVRALFGYHFRAHRMHKTQIESHRFMIWQNSPDISRIVRENTDTHHVSICVDTREQWEDLEDWLSVSNVLNVSNVKEQASPGLTLVLKVQETVGENNKVFEMLEQLYKPTHLKWSCGDMSCGNAYAFAHFVSVKSIDFLDKIQLSADLVTILCRMPKLDEVVLPSGMFYDCDYNADGYVWKQWGQQLALSSIKVMYVRFWVDMSMEVSRLVKWLEWIRDQWCRYWCIDIDYNDTENRITHGMHVLESVKMQKHTQLV